jgi:hypothetical protein
MAITVQLDAELQARLLAEARAQGVTLDAYLSSIVALPTAPIGTPEITSKDLESALNELADGSERLPILPPEAYRRDSIYGDI